VNPEPRTLNPHFPPSFRDFQVYQRVVVEAVSTRQAAAEFSRSQTRIRQIVQRVSQWLTENLPPQDDATDAALLRYAQHLAADRLSFFYSQAMDGWRAERQLKYFNLAIRLALAQSKLPVIPGTLECLAADAIEGPLPDDVGCAPPMNVLSREQTCSRSAEPDANALKLHSALPKSNQGSPRPGLVPANEHPHESPPPRDCSRAPKNSATITATESAQSIINQTPSNASAKAPSQASSARRAFLSPARPAPLTGDLPVTELKITPQQLGFAPTPTRSVSEGPLNPTQTVSQRRLSRHERRKLHRAKARA
jgi:hypothetical protein